MLNRKALLEFKDIYKSKFGVELSDEKAVEVATNFLNLMREIIEPAPEGVNKDEY